MSDRDFGYRREHTRLPCVLKGNYTSGDGISYVAKCLDISTKGLGVVTPTPLQIDSQVKIDLTTRNNLPLLLAGRVCWSRKVSEDKWQSGIVFNRQLPFKIERIA